MREDQTPSLVKVFIWQNCLEKKPNDSYIFYFTMQNP